MNALRRQNSRHRTHESPRKLARQSKAKRKQVPQSQANVFRHKCSLKQDAMERTRRRRGCGTD